MLNRSGNGVSAAPGLVVSIRSTVSKLFVSAQGTTPGQDELLIGTQVERLSCRQCMRPIPGTDIVISTGHKSSCRSEEPVDSADRNAFAIPAQDEWHVIRIGKSAAAANAPRDVGSEIVLREWERCCRGESSSTRQLLLADPGERIHVHENVVLPRYRQRITGVIFRVVARIEEQLVAISKPWPWSHSRIRCTHAQRVYAAILCVCVHGDNNDEDGKKIPDSLFVSASFITSSRDLSKSVRGFHPPRTTL